MLESGAYRYPLILVRDEGRFSFSSVTISASDILRLSPDGRKSRSHSVHCIYGVYLCTIRMQVGAAVVERAKSRRCINASRKSELYSTIGTAAIVAEWGPIWPPLRAGGIQVRSVQTSLCALYIRYIYSRLYLQNKITLVLFPGYIQPPISYQAPWNVNLLHMFGRLRGNEPLVPMKSEGCVDPRTYHGVEEYSAGLRQM